MAPLILGVVSLGLELGPSSSKVSKIRLVQTIELR